MNTRLTLVTLSPAGTVYNNDRPRMQQALNNSDFSMVFTGQEGGSYETARSLFHDANPRPKYPRCVGLNDLQNCDDVKDFVRRQHHALAVNDISEFRLNGFKDECAIAASKIEKALREGENVCVLCNYLSGNEIWAQLALKYPDVDSGIPFMLPFEVHDHYFDFGQIKIEQLEEAEQADKIAA